MTKKEMLKKLVDLAGKIETHEAWQVTEDLTDTDIQLRNEWESTFVTAKEMGITDDEIKKCKKRGIYLYEKHWCGISEYE